MAARAKKSNVGKVSPKGRRARAARGGLAAIRARRREGDADALRPRQGAARDSRPTAGRLPDRPRAPLGGRSGDRGAGPSTARPSRRRSRAALVPGWVTVVEQTEQRGTGHAVRLAMPALKGFSGGGLVLVLYGDVPLLRRETLAALVGTARRYRCLALVTATPPDPTGYGRILRDDRGNVIGVVEEKDASPEERAITEVNAGIYCGPADFFRTATAGLSTRNAQGSTYLTDIIARASEGIGVTAVEADFRDVAGVNDRQQLAEARPSCGADQPRAPWRTSPSAIPSPPTSSPASPSASTWSWGGRGAARPHQDRSRRAHRRRRHPHRHRGRCRRAHPPLLGRHRHGDRRRRDDRAVRAPAPTVPRSAPTPTSATSWRRRDQARSRQQGQPPQLPRRHHRRRKGEHRRRHHHLQLQRLREVEDGDRRRRFIGSDSQLVAPVRVGKGAVVGAGTTVQKMCRPGRWSSRAGADREARLCAEGGEEVCCRAQVRLGFTVHSCPLWEVPMPTSVKAFFDQKVPPFSPPVPRRPRTWQRSTCQDQRCRRRQPDRRSRLDTAHQRGRRGRHSAVHHRGLRRRLFAA